VNLRHTYFATSLYLPGTHIQAHTDIHIVGMYIFAQVYDAYLLKRYYKLYTYRYTLARTHTTTPHETNAQTRTHAHTCTHSHVHVHTRKCAHIHTHACKRAHAHTHFSHTLTHTQAVNTKANGPVSLAGARRQVRVACVGACVEFS